MKKRAIKGEWTRDFLIERATINEEARTVEFALSSETPYERWYGIEILGHGPGEVNLERLSNKAAWLVGHHPDDHVGVIESARVDPDHVLRVVVRFGRSDRASEIFQDIVDGIRTKVSVGYMTGDYEMTKGAQGSPDTYRFTNWMPYEGSTVSIPADDTVGAGRAKDGCQNKQCDDPECMNPECDGECSADAKCKSCTAKKATAPRQTRELPTTPPAPPAGTVKESNMDPKQQIAAALAAGTITQAQADAMLRALENPGGERAERVQALQLQAIAERMGLGTEAREILSGDKPLDQARAEILALVAEKGAQPLPGPGVNMSEKEAKQYSYTRAIWNAVQRMEGVKIARCFEDEVAETIERNLPANYDRKGGLLVPMQLRAGMDSVTAGAGAELKYDVFGGELIELLRNYCAVIGSGARVLNGLNGSVSFPKQLTDAIAYWMAENGGADAANSNPTFGSVTLAAKILIGATAFSRSMLSQSVIAVEAIVRQSLAAAHARAIDKAALHGTGANNQPTGIYRTVGVNTKAMGGNPTFGKLQDMITEVAVDNALLGALGFMTTPGMAGLLSQTLRNAVAGSDYIWTGNRQEGSVCGYKAVSTNQVSALMNGLVDAGGVGHGIIYGNWADVLIGMWGAMELVLDPYTLKKQGLIEVATHEQTDVQIRHAQSFCVATGATL